MTRRSSIWGVLVATGWSASASASDPTAVAGPQWVPSVQEEVLVRQLSLRDGSPPCAELEAPLADAVGSLRAVIANVTMPPWVPMRAADCLISGHATTARADLVIWVTEPGLKGLGILALGRLDAMPTDVAVEIATAAIARGPDPAGARRRISRAADPGVSALAVVKE